MAIDETNMVVAVANIQKRFETTQAIPEADCYTFSKLYTEAKRVGAKVKTEALTTALEISIAIFRYLHREQIQELLTTMFTRTESSMVHSPLMNF